MNLKNLQFIFMPHYWIMLKPYNKKVDKIINDLLDKYKLKKESNCRASLGSETIWIENYPYGFGNFYESKLDNFRPSRLTIRRIKRELDLLELEEVNNSIDNLRKKNLLQCKQ